MGRPVPVPLCAKTEVERAKRLAIVVMKVRGAIATGTGSVEVMY